MISAVYINGIEYNVEDGVVYKDTATEELDSITFQIKNVEELALEPNQMVKIMLQNGKVIYQIINTWVDEPASLVSPLKNYIINCISQTKQLERVQLPTMTITQRLNATDAEKKKYDVYLLRVLNRIKKVYPLMTLSNQLITKAKEVIAVEEQFNTPNSKDYINNILSKLVALVKVDNNSIGYLDLSNKGKAIDESKLFFKTKSQQINDYYSGIITDVQGVQSEDATIIKELVGVRAIDSAVASTDNVVVALSHNINYIVKVTAYATCDITYTTSEGTTTSKGVLQAFDIYSDKRKLIKEKAEYDLLKVSNEITQYSDDYKRSNLYFVRGNNTIEGLTYNEKTWFVGLDSVFPAIENIFVKMGNENDIIVSLVDDIRDIKFEVTYSALDDVSVRYDKDKSFNSVIRDNQSESYVDLDKFAKVQKEKLNRLGNPSISISARYYDLDDVPALLDYIGDYVLAEREIVYHRDYIDFKGTLYKDYVKENVFYGVNARKRTTPLLIGNQAVTRKELIKNTFELSYNNNGTSTYIERYLIGKICATNYSDISVDSSFMTSIDFKPIQIAIATSYFSNGGNVSYKLEPDVRKADKGVTINFKFYDNINVGMRYDGIKTPAQGNITKGGYGQQFVTYTDGNGELVNVGIRLYDKYDLVLKNDKEITDTYPSLSKASQYIDENYLITSQTFELYKDQREILNLTLQFEITSEEGIYITDNFIDMLPFFNKPKYWLSIYMSETETYDKYNCSKVVASAVRRDDIEIYHSDFKDFAQNHNAFNRIKLYNIDDKDLSNIKSWALADNAGNVYLAVNKRDDDITIPTTIYLNKKGEN